MVGEFEIEPGAGQITLPLEPDLAVDPYSLWLVRLPDARPKQAREFSFQKFDVLPNRITFKARLHSVTGEGFYRRFCQDRR